MTDTTKRPPRPLTDRLKALLDEAIEALDTLIAPPEAVLVPVRRPRRPRPR